jgi:hypothetical protein
VHPIYHHKRWVSGISGQAVFPEKRLIGRFEMGFIPGIAPSCPPHRMKRVQIGHINRKTFGVFARNKQWPTGNRNHIGLIFANPHIVIAPDRKFVGFKINIVTYGEIHAASNTINHQTVCAWSFKTGKINIPYIRTE